MDRRNIIVGSAGALLLAAALGLVFLAGGGDAGERADDLARTAEARIDRDCRSVPGEISVPEGMAASSFARVEFAEGTACGGSGPPENKGFAVYDRNNSPVYMWSQYQDQPPYERGGPLSGLVLKPGAYVLSVAGGAGASVKLSFEVK